MEEIKNCGICPLTGWQISNVEPQDYNWIYVIFCANYSFRIWVSRTCFKDQEIMDSKHLIRWLILNKKILSITDQLNFTNPSSYLLTPQKIKQVISESFVPTTPKEKLDQLLLILYKVFPYYFGEINRSKLFSLTFFVSPKEFDIYFDCLEKTELVSVIKNTSSEKVIFESRNQLDTSLNIRFNFKGIDHLASIEQNGRNSKNCFIAMSFSEDPQIVAIKEAIKSAVNEAKYNPIIISEKHIDSDQTINDAIIAEIKRAKFVVADFTEQKSGVYFEAGFALGLGLPVIYCCEEEDFKKNSHFDVNHYPHILYKTPEQLEKALIDKIRAWID